MNFIMSAVSLIYTCCLTCISGTFTKGINECKCGNCAKPGHLMQSVHVAQFFIIQELRLYYCNSIVEILFLKSLEAIFITVDLEDGCICTFV